MSATASSKRAIEWLEQQLADLAGIRNATSRDPSFKNWRQATLTVMQRIWPADQDRSERFRRIPFSPADPRADLRAMREWYSRGCQEAGRVLKGFIEDIKQNGVPDMPPELLPEVPVGELQDDFPTVDLPAGDLGSTAEPGDVPDDLLADLGDISPSFDSAPQLTVEVPAQPETPVVLGQPAAPPPPVVPPVAAAPAAPAAPAPEQGVVQTRQAKKGPNLKSRLRDLLGFAHLSAKALAGTPQDAQDEHPPAPHQSAPVPHQSEPASHRTTPAPPQGAPASHRTTSPPPLPADPFGLGVQALGDDVTPTTNLPPPVLHERVAPPEEIAAAPLPGEPVPDLDASAAVPPADEPAEQAGNASVVMSRTTTLRGSIEKVSIESLISPEFRTPGAEDAPQASAPRAAGPAASDPAPSTRAPRDPANAAPPAPVPAAPAATRPPLSLVPPLLDDLETGPASIAARRPEPPAPPPPPVAQAPAPAPPPPAAHAPAAEPASPRASGAKKKVVPLPAKPAPAPPARPAPPPPADEPVHSEEPEQHVDPEEFARAAEDFMRSSPVLGATGHRVKRGIDAPDFGDADAIAVASMAQELSRLGVPDQRQAETRARLLDLARRLERGDLDWPSLRKAVWFAMEYPEMARRLMPVLLPWIDRAA